MLLLINNLPDLISNHSPTQVGLLVTPTGKKNIGQQLGPHPYWIGVDNGCYNADSVDSFNQIEQKFIDLTYRLDPGRLAFVASPDIIADPDQTLELFYGWRPHFLHLRLRTALVLQDGMTTQDIPWPELEAVFVGGTDQYKFSPDVYRICLQAKQHRKWIHFGRINSKRKLSLAHDYHAHSVDGLHWSFYTHKNLAQGIEWVQSIKSQGRLFDNATLIQDH